MTTNAERDAKLKAVEGFFNLPEEVVAIVRSDFFRALGDAEFFQSEGGYRDAADALCRAPRSFLMADAAFVLWHLAIEMAVLRLENRPTDITCAMRIVLTDEAMQAQGSVLASILVSSKPEDDSPEAQDSVWYSVLQRMALGASAAKVQ